MPSNAWTEHVRTFRSSHPTLTFKECLQSASKTFHRSQPSSERYRSSNKRGRKEKHNESQEAPGNAIPNALIIDWTALLQNNKLPIDWYKTVPLDKWIIIRFERLGDLHIHNDFSRILKDLGRVMMYQIIRDHFPFAWYDPVKPPYYDPLRSDRNRLRDIALVIFEDAKRMNTLPEGKNVILQGANVNFK